MIAKVESIYITREPDDDFIELQHASLEKNKGIVGDRYHKNCGTWSKAMNKPDRNLSLIESENIIDIQTLGISLEKHEFRRNIITKDIRLNQLVGKYFTIGQVLCFGIRLCEPCRYLEQYTGYKLVKTMLNKGGLRAQILNNGIVNIGAKITEVNPPATLKQDEVEHQHFCKD